MTDYKRPEPNREDEIGANRIAMAIIIVVVLGIVGGIYKLIELVAGAL